MKKQLISILFTAFTLLAPVVHAENTATPPYKTIDSIYAKDLQTKDKILVTEFFSFGCPHCAHLEQGVKNWLKNKPKNVEFQQIPVSFGRDSWTVLAKAYYIAKTLDSEEHPLRKMTIKLFHAVQEENVRFTGAEDLAAFFAKQGYDESKVKDLYNSFSIDQAVRRGNGLAKNFQIMGIPNIIVNGQYQTGPWVTGGPKGVFPAVSEIIKLISKETAKTPKLGA